MTAEIRTYIRREIDKHVRNTIQPRRGPQTMRTHEDWVIEVDSALLAYHRDGPWPPNVHVPTVALSALVGT